MHIILPISNAIEIYEHELVFMAASYSNIIFQALSETVLRRQSVGRIIDSLC